MRFPCFASLLLVTGALLGGCDPSMPADVGPDARLDAPERSDTPRDTGPPCELTCSSSEACCVIADEPMCIDVYSDPLNCGRCGNDCLATRRGDHCLTRQCACGTFDIGCTGTVDECCPAIPGRAEAHCANTRLAESDCGTCGNVCEPTESNECRNGACVCGTSDRGCAGTPEDLCCEFGLAGGTFACTDTLTDDDHCGGCERRCRADQRCAAGTCVGLFDAGPATDAGIDAGSDAGEPDAGTDAGDPGPDA